MTVLSNFKFGPHVRPLVDTYLGLLNNGDGQQEQFILKTLEPLLNPTLVAQIRGVFSKSLQQAQAVEEPAQKKRKLAHNTQAIDASYRNAVKMVEREIEVVSSCRPNADRNATLRRAEARAFERVFFAQSGFPVLRERTIYFQGVASFLNMRDLLCGVACVSPEMNCSVSQLHPRIWEGFAETFPLPKEIYWKEYSQKQVKNNWELLGKFNACFSKCLRSARNVMKEYSEVTPFPKGIPGGVDRRKAFATVVKPIIAAMAANCEANEEEGTDPIMYIDEMLRSIKIKKLPIGQAISFPTLAVDMCLACGEKIQNPEVEANEMDNCIEITKNLVIDVVCDAREKNGIRRGIPAEDYSRVLYQGMKQYSQNPNSPDYIDQKYIFEALTRIFTYGEALPFALFHFWEGFVWLENQYFVPLVRLLLQREVAVDERTAQNGLIFEAAKTNKPELIELLIKAGLTVLPSEFSFLIYQLVGCRVSAETLLHIIDVLLNKGIDSEESYQAELLLDDIDDSEEIFSGGHIDLFAEVEKYHNAALSQKVTALGLKR